MRTCKSRISSVSASGQRRALSDERLQNSTVLSGDPVEQVGRLKEQPGQDIVLTASISLGHTLVAAGLVDEYRLWVYPTVQGGGRRLFPAEHAMKAFRLIEPPKRFHGDITLPKCAGFAAR